MASAISEYPLANFLLVGVWSSVAASLRSTDRTGRRASQNPYEELRRHTTNRKRNIQIEFYVTEGKKLLINERMKLPTQWYGAYFRKMAINGYIIYTDTADIKAFIKELSAVGRQLAHEILGGKYEYVIATHINKEHRHNHIIFCAVDFAEHKKYISNRKSYARIRRISNRLYQETRLSLVTPSAERGKQYAEWDGQAISKS